MTDYFTIKIPQGDGERHNERRKELGLTWVEYIDGEAPESADVAIPDDLREQLGRIEAAAKEATTAAQSAETAVEELETHR